MANIRQQDIEEDDEDILALRETALRTLQAKRDPVNHEHHQHSQQASAVHVPFHQDQHSSNMNYSPVIHGYPRHPLPINGIEQMNFTGRYMQDTMRPRHMNNQLFRPEMLPRPTFHPRQRPAFQQQRQPMMPIVQPHLNRHFIPQHHPQQLPFVPVVSDMSPLHTMPMEQHDEEMPLLPDITSAFEPTPPSRLSPRSAQFVLSNEEALRRQKRRRSFSPGRSRSRSPYTYRHASRSRSRSRSPVFKPQVSHIARKRTRSKTPENGYTNKFVRKSRSPRRPLKTLEKRPSPKYSENDRVKRNPNYKYNGNGAKLDRHGNVRKELDRRPRSPPKTFDKKEGDDKKQETEKLPVNNEVEKDESKQEPRKKTEQEIEDELLASTDSEGSEKGVDDDDEFKVTLDEKELDFLDDDEEESENEGRFKSKATTSTQHKKPMSTSSFKSSYATKNFDKPKSFNSNEKHYSRHDYRRRDDSKRDKKSSPIRDKRTPDRKNKKSPEARKSPEVIRKPKESIAPSRVIILNSKDKSEAVKEDTKIKTEKLPFKSTFKLMKTQGDDKKKDEEARKDERVRLVRVMTINRAAPAKDEKPEKTKEVDTKRPAIMKRLGGYIKEKPTKAWAKDQLETSVIEAE